MNRHSICCGLALLLISGAADAQTSACVTRKIASQQEQYYLDAKGNPTSRLVAAGELAQGDELAYTIAVKNICVAPVMHVMIDEPVPPDVTYTKTTAKGDGTDRMFSLDGNNFARWDDLKVVSAGGSTRPAEVKDIKSIRWVFKVPIDPGETKLVHFHAVAN